MEEARQSMMNWVAQIEVGQVPPSNYPNDPLPSFSFQVPPPNYPNDPLPSFSAQVPPPNYPNDLLPSFSAQVPPPNYPNDPWPSFFAQVPPSNYPNDPLPSFSTCQPPNYGGPIRRTSTSWTLREHKLFLLGVDIFGWGKWKKISETVVMTKTAAQLASHAQKFRERGIETGVKRRGSIHDITLADISPEDWNELLSSLPHLMPHHSHHHNHHSLSMTQQLGTQIHQPYQASTPAHHVLPMNQLGSQIPSSFRQPHQATTPVLVLLPNQLGTQMNPLCHHHHSLPMNHLGTQIPSQLQLQEPHHQPNSQVLVSQSPSRNQGDQSESQFSYHTFLPPQNPSLNHMSTPWNHK